MRKAYYMYCLKIMTMVRYMTEYVTVTERGMTTIPARLKRKYGIKSGMKLEVVEEEKGILFVPIPKLEDLFGVDGDLALEMIKELKMEKRKEIERDKAKLQLRL